MQLFKKKIQNATKNYETQYFTKKKVNKKNTEEIQKEEFYFILLFKYKIQFAKYKNFKKIKNRKERKEVKFVRKKILF